VDALDREKRREDRRTDVEGIKTCGGHTIASFVDACMSGDPERI
jgi:hypothetical protein